MKFLILTALLSFSCSAFANETITVAALSTYTGSNFVILTLNNRNDVTCKDTGDTNYFYSSTEDKEFEIKLTADCVAIKQSMAKNLGIAFAFDVSTNPHDQYAGYVAGVKNLHKPLSEVESPDRPKLGL